MVRLDHTGEKVDPTVRPFAEALGRYAANHEGENVPHLARLYVNLSVADRVVFFDHFESRLAEVAKLKGY